MSFDSQVRRNSYVGNGTVDVYPYTFKIFAAADLLVLTREIVDGEVVETELNLDTDYSVDGVGFKDGGNVTLLGGDLPDDVDLIILGNREYNQTTRIRNQERYYADIHEDTFDKIVMMIQQLRNITDRCVKIAITDPINTFLTTLPPATIDQAKYLIRINEDGDALEYVSPAEVLADAMAGGGALPVGGEAGDLLTKLSDDAGDAGWISGRAQGFSQRYNQAVDLLDIQAVIAFIFNFGYSAPQVTLSASGNTLREKGTVVTSTTLTAAITKRSDPIAEVRFYRNPSTLLDTQTAGGGIPSGGNSTYGWTGSFEDTTTFRVEVDDTSSEAKPSASVTTTFNFVRPYFWGSDASDSLTAAQVAAKTKDIRVSSASVERTFLVSGGSYFYFAQPASYPAITQIFDVNNFDVTANWTSFTGNYTALDGSTQSLRVYRILSPQGSDAYFRFVR